MHVMDLRSSLQVPDIEQVKSRVRDTEVAFIIPPSVFLADERVFPFLGILKVAAEFRRNGNPVEVLDLSGYQNYLQIVSEFARQTSARHFAITATTPQLPATVEIALRLRQELGEVNIILGGAHATLSYSGMEQDHLKGRFARGTMAFDQLVSVFDRLVVGDGELATFLAVDPSYNDRVINAGDRKSPLFLKKGDLENFQYPARDLIDHASYHYQIDGHRSFSVIAQLGCPFECGFCGGRDSHFLRTARPRSPRHAVQEIEDYILEARAEGIDYSGVMFYDDELNVSLGNLETLCRELISLQDRLGVQMGFRGFVKAELFTREQAELMYRAGFRILLSGIESGSDSMLLAMKKHTSRAINTRMVNFAHEAGLRVKALMSIGHPGESEGSIEQSVEWVERNLQADWDDADWTIITQYPGSPYFDHSDYDKDKKAWKYTTVFNGQPAYLYSREMNYAKDAYYYKGIPGEYDVYVWTDFLDESHLARLRDHAEQSTRASLKLPPITAISSRTFEHSMGQALPRDLLRSSKA
jgi:anaerobic magnesium-protoporphyrin IX monomethyl ester cyclase